MNSRHFSWICFGLGIAIALIFTACSPVPVEEPVPTVEPAEPAETKESSIVYEFPPPIEGEFVCIEGDNVVCTIGENEDVRVIIPWQPEHAAFLYAVNLPMDGSVEDFRNEERDEFKPYRLVLNFELVINPSFREGYINNFLPPIELGVRYTEADVVTSGGLENLQLGFWDEENKYWVSFRQHGKYSFKIEGDEMGGYIWVIISSWGDRRIGYG
jgi:hypothetical protein